jgi:hypothetical protein
MAGGKISQLRRGVRPHKLITLGYDNNTIDVMVVLLSSDVMQLIEEQTEEYCQANPKRVNQKVRQKYHNKLLCHYSMRDPSDPTYEKLMTDDVNDVGSLDDEDIKRVCEAYSELMVNRAPKLEMLKQEEFEELKKVLEVIQLSDLSTVSLVHLTHFLRTVVSEK